jgi:hypothetical protein
VGEKRCWAELNADPILGMVTLYLKDVLKDNSHFTR